MKSCQPIGGSSKTAHYLALGLALHSAASRDVLPGTPIVSHAYHAEVRCRERLASRSPPLLSRCLITFPEDAWMGETPQRLAKEASLFRRCGLSLRPLSAASLHGP